MNSSRLERASRAFWGGWNRIPRRQRALKTMLGLAWAIAGGTYFWIPPSGLDVGPSILALSLEACIFILLWELSDPLRREEYLTTPRNPRKKRLSHPEALAGAILPMSAMFTAHVGFGLIPQLLMAISIVILIWLIVLRDVAGAFEDSEDSQSNQIGSAITRPIASSDKR